MRNRYLRGLLAVVFVGAWAVALTAQQGQTSKPAIKMTSASPTKTIDGRDSYDAYCAVCHGKDGKGGGPAAAALKSPLPDLTTIAARHDNVFPRKTVEETITGVNRPAAHGTVEMPIWGPVFRAVDPNMITLRVHNLLDHVEAMQGNGTK